MDGHTHVLRLLLAADSSVARMHNDVGMTPLDWALCDQHIEAARCLLEEAPLQPAGEILELLSEWGDADAQPLCACLAARLPMTAEQWAEVPTPCTGLGAALPAVLQRSADEAALLARHLPPSDHARLRTAALCLVRAQRRHDLPLPAPIIQRLLQAAV
jgi:hypothetical protein